MGYLAPTEAQGAALMARGLTGPVTMLNLLRFRDRADYAGAPNLAPRAPITGRAAFERYMAATLPLLRARGGDVLHYGAGGPWFIGPEDAAGWDAALLVRHASLSAFLSFAEDEGYNRDAIGHRSAALRDARLLPLDDRPIPEDAAPP